MTQTTRAAISLCGLPVRAENVRQLARRLEGDPLREKLERALHNNNSIVALDFEERARIVEALKADPPSLPGLRTELESQIKKHDNQAQVQERAKRYREIENRRNAERDRQMNQP